MTSWLHRLDARDRALFLRVALTPACAHPARAAWMAITHAGGARVSIGATVGTLAVPGMPWAVVWRTLLVLGVSHLLVQAVKRTVGRPRPARGASVAALITVPDRFSFPSGHACAAMAVALGFAHAFPALTVPLVVLAALVGASRVVLGVHYPGDVLVGQALAWGTALLLP